MFHCLSVNVEGGGGRRCPSMGQEPGVTMNPASSGKSSTRSSGYHQKALAAIRNSLLPFANIGCESGNVGSSAASTISTLSTTSGVSSASGHSSTSNGVDKELNALRQALAQLIAMGYSEVSSPSFYMTKIFSCNLAITIECMKDSALKKKELSCG